MSLHKGPTIDDLLADSLIRVVMRADHVEPEALKALLNGARPDRGRAPPAHSAARGSDVPRQPRKSQTPSCGCSIIRRGRGASARTKQFVLGFRA
jgi:hypothetical protein